MPRLPFPAYCLHRATDQAFCTTRVGTQRKVHYLGNYGTEQSLDRYATTLRESGLEPAVVEQAVTVAKKTIGSGNGPLPSATDKSKPVTVLALYNAYHQFALNYYRLPNGDLSREVENFRHSFTDCLDLLGSRDVATLSRSDLLTVRQRMVDRKLSRGVINQRVGRIVRVFVWGGDDGRALVPDSVAAAFRLVTPLKPFRDGARETEPIEAVPLEDLKKVLEVAHPVLKAMLAMQFLTGMRPGEVRGLRKRMVRQEEGGWVAVFGTAHKMAYRKRTRNVAIGPQGIEVLRPWLDLCTGDNQFVFRPEQAPKSANRVRKDHYSKDAYILAVSRACAAAGVAAFGPNRVRHLSAVEIRKEFGLEAVQSVLGHSHFSTTERYAPTVSDLAREVADKRG